jgi:hypothetical protein
MAMKIEFQKGSAYMSEVLKKEPSITGFTRLETQPTAVSMKIGLQAPVADPLWMLSRQWQFNEFQGEDAGTPLNVTFAVEGTPVDAFRPGKGDAPWQALERGGPPIETRVEAEPVWKTHPRFRGEAGLQLLRMAASALSKALLQGYALELPVPTDPQADQSGLLWATILDRRTVDAQKLVSDLTPLRGGDGKLAGLPAALALGAADAAAARSVLDDWLAWIDRAIYEGPADNPAWQRNRLEYAFSLRTGPVAVGANAVRLAADEYTDGHVDWESFEAESLAAQAEPSASAFAVEQRHPTPVRYPGMPADRYWEFEDASVNFAGAEAGVTDLLRMSITEFALTFGNDWFLVPVRLPVGALYRVTRFEVVDSFGIRAVTGPVQNVNQTPWEMFCLSTGPNLQRQLAHTMLLPDALDGVIEGAVLEQTLLVRDEMANLAWAIEKKVQGVSGEPLDRDMEAKGLAFLQQIKFPAPPSPQLVYRLASPVPANWTPLLPVRKDGLIPTDPLEIQLERAGMKRFYPAPAALAAPDPAYADFLTGLDAQVNFITPIPMNPAANVKAYVFYPRGWLLRRDPEKAMPENDTLIIEEEEVPRIGAILKRTFQYARSSDGQSWLWIGRSKLAGRGEASSNLRFDTAVKATTTR